MKDRKHIKAVTVETGVQIPMANTELERVIESLSNSPDKGVAEIGQHLLSKVDRHNEELANAVNNTYESKSEQVDRLCSAVQQKAKQLATQGRELRKAFNEAKIVDIRSCLTDVDRMVDELNELAQLAEGTDDL